MKSFERKLNMKKNSYELLNDQNMNSSLKLILSFNFFSKTHVLKIFTNGSIYMDFISLYLSHNFHLTHDNKIDYQYNIIKWILWTLTYAKMGPLIHAFSHLQRTTSHG
jgi:hypothetical protein